MYRDNILFDEWESYMDQRKKDPYKAKLLKMKLKEDKPSNRPFLTYWIMNMMVHENPDNQEFRNKMKDILANAKKVSNENKIREKEYENDYKNYFHDQEIVWDSFLPYNETYNSYDTNTSKCIIPWRMSKDEEDEFRDMYWIDFVDPYCDGRDCTGAPFTSYMKFLHCKDRTIIIHRVDFDL